MPLVSALARNMVTSCNGYVIGQSHRQNQDDHDIFCVCFDVMYSGEYNVSDVTLSVQYIHTGQAKKFA
jgi:hypothetical protein